MMQKNTKRFSMEMMLPLIERWQQSSMSKIGFCRTENLNIHTFNYWLSKLKNCQADASVEGFLPIKVKNFNDNHNQSPGIIEVHCTDGTTIILNGSVTAQYLGQLIRSLQPCLR